MKSIKSACSSWAETIAAYRLLNNLKLNQEAILAPHREAIRARAQQYDCVAVLQDTTEFDFTRKKTMEGVGPLNSETRRGVHAHNQFVVTEDRLPLGVLGTKIFARSDEDFRAKKRKQLPFEEKESYRWLEGYQQACEFAGGLPDTEVFSISDREGDIYEIYHFWNQLRSEEKPAAQWIIRANQDRSLSPAGEEEEEQIRKLFEKAGRGKELGTIEFDVKECIQTKKVKGKNVRTTRSKRHVRQRVKACEVTLKPPYRKGSKLDTVTFWVVLAEEIDPPEGEAPIRWVLLTSKPVKSFEDAQKILKLYLARWEIEVFHRVLKTGCKVEEIQLKDDKAVVNCIVLYMIVAWRILYLTHLGRKCPDLPCSVVFSEAEWKSAVAVAEHSKELKNPVEGREPTLGEMIQIVAQLGGHLGRKNDGAPGAQAIWQGLNRVRDFALAWESFQSLDTS